MLTAPAGRRNQKRRRPMRSTIVLLALLASLPVSAFPDHPTTTPDITAADLAARDKAIADDAFEGRGPGTKNGEAAADWIADEMKRIGLRPGNNGSYFQEVPAVTITLEPAKSSFALVTR